MVPNEVNDACQRCLLTARAVCPRNRLHSKLTWAQCDKKGRGGEDDPCSECRWFGGQNCRCRLIPDSSYNDQLWSVMMLRAEYDYNLPPQKGRDEVKPGKAPPAPMSDARLKADWRGESRAQLMAKPDMLPSYIRQRPRAYLAPPRPSMQRKKTAASKSMMTGRQPDTSGKTTGFEHHAPLTDRTSGALSMHALPQLPPRPAAHPQLGEVVETAWSWVFNQFMHVYASGTRVVVPRSDRPKQRYKFNIGLSSTSQRRDGV